MPGNRKQLQKQERERKCLNFLFARHLSSVISTEDMGNKHEYIRCNRDQKSQWYTAARWEAILCYIYGFILQSWQSRVILHYV